MKLQKFRDVFPNTPEPPETKEGMIELAEKVNKTFLGYFRDNAAVYSQVDVKKILDIYKAELIEKIEKLSTVWISDRDGDYLDKGDILSIIKET